MRSLYNIDNDIVACIDPETGEVDEERITALQMERDEKIEKVLLWYKDTVSFAAELKAQETAFAERRKSTENLAERLKAYLSRALNGEKFETATCKASFKKSSSVVCAEDFVQWAMSNERDDLLTYKEPTANKKAIKDAIASGEKLPAEIVESNNIQIK